MREKTRRSIFWQLLNDHMLDVSEGTETILKTERVVVVVVSFDESCLAGLKIFLGVHVVRILLHLVSLGLFAVVDTFFEIVLNDIHLCDDALNSYKLIGHFAA